MATKAKIDNSKIVIQIDGVTYELTPGNLTGAIVRQVREATGMSLNKAMQQMADDADLDTLAVVCFAAALQAGKKADFSKIEASVSYTSDIKIEQVQEDDQGEA